MQIKSDHITAYSMEMKSTSQPTALKLLSSEEAWVRKNEMMEILHSDTEADTGKLFVSPENLMFYILQVKNQHCA